MRIDDLQSIPRANCWSNCGEKEPRRKSCDYGSAIVAESIIVGHSMYTSDTSAVLPYLSFFLFLFLFYLILPRLDKSTGVRMSIFSNVGP